EAAAGWAQRSLARQQALTLTSRAQQAEARRQALEQIARARAAWHQATEPTRQQAYAADTELRRRHPGIDLRPLHSEQGHGTQPKVGREGHELVRVREADAFYGMRARRTADRLERQGGQRTGQHAQPELELEAGG